MHQQEIGSKMKLSEHFHDYEFKCKCGCGLVNIHPDFLQHLELIRRIHRQPMTVTSGCRCPEYNRKVGGAQNSMHLTTENKPCRAVDVIVKVNFRELVHITAGLSGGMGLYHKHKNMIHIDNGGTRMWIH